MWQVLLLISAEIDRLSRRGQDLVDPNSTGRPHCVYYPSTNPTAELARQSTRMNDSGRNDPHGNSCRPKSQDQLPLQSRRVAFPARFTAAPGTPLPYAHPGLQSFCHAKRLFHQLAAGSLQQSPGTAGVPPEDTRIRVDLMPIDVIRLALAFREIAFMVAVRA